MKFDPEANLPDEVVDDIITGQFPRPIALLYQRMLDATDPKQQIELSNQAFEFCIRTISLTLVIRYLETPEKDVNLPELNQKIKDYLPKARIQQWIEMLELTLQVYQGKRARFFVPEFYDLHWRYDSERNIEVERQPSIWGILTAFAKHIQDGTTPDEAPAIMAALRSVLRYFLPIQNYLLLLVYGVAPDGLQVEKHRGQGNLPDFVPWERVKGVLRSEVKEGYYYLANEDGVLLALDPLILTPVRLNVDASTDDVGVYDSYYENENRQNRIVDLLFYVLLASRRDAHETFDGDLVSKFQRLLHHLARKQQAALGVKQVNWQNLKQVAADISEHQMKDNALTKYDEKVYVEREELTKSVYTFLEDPAIAMIITGEAGVGKTNLLVRLYQDMRPRDGWVVIWLEGADLKPGQPLAEQVLSKLKIRLDLPPVDSNDMNVQLAQFLGSSLFYNRGLLLMLDGVNENDTPLGVFETINDFMNEFAGNPHVKLIVSSRPQVWQYVRSQLMLRNYRPTNLYGSSKTIDLTQSGLSAIDQDSFVLKRYTAKEQGEAFEKYRNKHNLRNPNPESLDSRLKTALLDPLLMSLTCRAWEKEGEIPNNFQPEDIIPKLIDTMVRFGHEMNLPLQQEDIDGFLQGRLIPKLFPEGRRPENQLARNMLIGDRELEDLLVDVSVNSRGVPTNAQYVRLERTGWLVKARESVNFVVRFRYEFFYDYFAGKYLYEQYRVAADKTEVFKYLSDAPFLWGPLRNTLLDILKYESDYASIDALARQADEYQMQLLTSVLAEYYPLYRDKIHRLLIAWLTPNYSEKRSSSTDASGSSSSAAEIAASVSVLCRVEDLIELVLCHPVERVRLGVIQNIHILWNESPEMVTRVMVKVAAPIRLLSFARRRAEMSIRAFTLVQCTLLLVMTNYSNIEKKPGRITIVDLLHQVWRPIIGRLLLVRGQRWQEAFFKRGRSVFTRLLIRFFVIRSLDKNLADLEFSTSQIVFGYNELKASFPASPGRRAVFKALMPHMEGAQPDVPLRLDDLADTIVELARNHDYDVLSSYVVLGSLDAYFMRAPLETAQTIEKLYERLAEVFPVTEDLNNPTGNIWFPITHYPLGFNLLRVGQPQYREVSTILTRIGYLKEERYRNLWPMGKGTLLRPNNIADLLTLYVDEDYETGRAYIDKYVTLLTERQDHFQIKRCISALADGTTYGAAKVRNALDAGILLISDVLHRLQPYLANLKQKQPQLYDEFWDDVDSKLKQYLGKNRPHLLRLVDMCDDNVMPPHVKDSIIKDATLQEDFNFTLMLAILWFLFDIFQDKNPFGRDILRWALGEVLEAKSLQDFILRCTVRATYLVYGEELL